MSKLTSGALFDANIYEIHRYAPLLDPCFLENLLEIEKCRFFGPKIVQKIRPKSDTVL